MTNSTAGYLRLHVEGLPEPLSPLVDEISAVDDYCRAFTEHTGWVLRYAPRSGVAGRAIWSRSIAGETLPRCGTLVLEPAEKANQAAATVQEGRVKLVSAKCLADSFGEVLSELERTRHALWQREAELAAGVPVSIRLGDELHLAARLESVLQGGAQAIGCQAAGLYLLDEATTVLKLRACFGLPRQRLIEPARPLKYALADLEALIGHAVALEDVAALPHWKAPEEFPSAVCVPVASPSTPLGTLWLFSEQRRGFTPEQTNLVEIIAGRIASDLEREMLVEAGSNSRQLSHEFSAAAEWQRNRLPFAPPLLDGWQLAAWTSHQGEPVSSFYDWQELDDGHVAALLGSVAGTGLAASLSSGALQSFARAHAQHVADTGELLTRVAGTFAAGSLGDERATMFFARLAPQLGQINFAAAGNLMAWMVCEEGCRPLAGIGEQLGGEADFSIYTRSEQFGPDDALVAIAWNPRSQGTVSFPTNLICESLTDRRRQSAAVLLDAVRAAIASQLRPVAAETTVMVLKRRR